MCDSRAHERGQPREYHNDSQHERLRFPVDRWQKSLCIEVISLQILQAETTLHYRTTPEMQHGLWSGRVMRFLR